MQSQAEDRCMGALCETALREHGRASMRTGQEREHRLVELQRPMVYKEHHECDCRVRTFTLLA